jgi:hypothetical protein
MLARGSIDPLLHQDRPGPAGSLSSSTFHPPAAVQDDERHFFPHIAFAPRARALHEVRRVQLGELLCSRAIEARGSQTTDSVAVHPRE